MKKVYVLIGKCIMGGEEIKMILSSQEAADEEFKTGEYLRIEIWAVED